VARQVDEVGVDGAFVVEGVEKSDDVFANDQRQSGVRVSRGDDASFRQGEAVGDEEGEEVEGEGDAGGEEVGKAKVGFPAAFPKQPGREGDERDGHGGESLELRAGEANEPEDEVGKKAGPVFAEEKPEDGGEDREGAAHIGLTLPRPEEKSVASQQNPAGGVSDGFAEEEASQANGAPEQHQSLQRARQPDGVFVDLSEEGGGNAGEPVGTQRLVEIEFAVEDGVEKVAAAQHFPDDQGPAVLGAPNGVSEAGKKQQGGDAPK